MQEHEKTIGQRIRERVETVRGLIPNAVEPRRQFLVENRLNSPMNKYGMVTYLTGLQPETVADMSTHILYTTYKNPYLLTKERLELLESDPPEQYVMEAYQTLAERYMVALGSAAEVKAYNRAMHEAHRPHMKIKITYRVRSGEKGLRNRLIDQALKLMLKEEREKVEQVLRQQRREFIASMEAQMTDSLLDDAIAEELLKIYCEHAEPPAWTAKDIANDKVRAMVRTLLGKGASETDAVTIAHRAAAVILSTCPMKTKNPLSLQSRRNVRPAQAGRGAEEKYIQGF